MLSNSTMAVITGVSIVIGVLGLMIGVLPALKKKGYNVDKALDTANDVINKADTVLNVAKEVLPNNPVVNTLSIMEKLAKIGVGDAEQLSHAGDISKEERAQVAENVVLTGLQESNIPVTDNMKVLIDVFIKEAVNDLGHAPADTKQLQTTIEQQNTQNAQLQQKNEQLQQTITTITTAAQAVQTTSSVNTETPATAPTA